MSIIGEIVRADSSHPFWGGVLLLDSQHFPQPWCQKDWEELDFTRHILFILVKDQILTGYVLFHALQLDDTVHLLKICMAPEFRGQKLAQGYWYLIERELRLLSHKSIYLEVETGNLPAQSFYRKIGFNPLRIIKSFYSNGADAQTMLMTL